MTVFVHSWFRSGSTWFWSKFRNDEQHAAYYEPLNEELPLWTPERLQSASARAFPGDNHPSLDRHYFHEYLDLISSGRLGFDKSISYERYLLGGGDDDPPLKNYLSGLISDAGNKGLTPALCFCRSQMRASWMKQNFDGLHIAQIRNPWDQWRSFGKHQYFKNRVLLTAYCIDKRHPGCFTHISGFNALATAWNSGQQAKIDELDCFHVYALIWVASAAQSIAASDFNIDIDLLAASDTARSQTSAKLERLGLPADLSDVKSSSPTDDGTVPHEYRLAMNNAVSALRDKKSALLFGQDQVALDEQLGDLTDTNAGIIRQLTA